MRTLALIIGLAALAATCGAVGRRHELSLSPSYHGGDRLQLVVIDRTGLVVGIDASIRGDAFGLTNPAGHPDVLRFMWYSQPCEKVTELVLTHGGITARSHSEGAWPVDCPGWFMRRAIDIKLSAPLVADGLALDSTLATQDPGLTLPQTNEQRG